jgi:hypothetical protein
MSGTRKAERGIALVPALLVVSGLAIFALALLTAVLSGKRTVNYQNDDYKLSAAVESVAVLAMNDLWSDYLTAQGGAAGTIASFRTYLDGRSIDSEPGSGTPAATDGESLIGALGLSNSPTGNPTFDDVNVDAVNVVRRDSGESTQLWVTVSASTRRGESLVNPVLNRALQQVWTVEPTDFEGFEYALLANNVNCVFCHAQVDNVERWFNADPGAYGSFERIKVGMLESLMLRHDVDGLSAVNDFDADSYLAGTVYSRGSASLQGGAPIGSWASLSFQGYSFDGAGQLVEDGWGALSSTPFVPAGLPLQALENLYLAYPEDYGLMVDGALPSSFPAPIPDDGGPIGSGAGNRVVDDAEFEALAATADGAITAGILNLQPAGDVIDSVGEYAAALFLGNQASLQQSVTGDVILSGTTANPITIDGTVCIDGDVVINGYVKGEGTLVVRGNVYVPTDLRYLDGLAYLPGDVPGIPTGPRTFGIAQDGTRNALGLTAGGNVLIGDYLQPSTLQPDGSYAIQGPFEIVDGSSSGEWNFGLAEVSIFNRGEWMRTQPMLPGSPGEASLPSSSWTAVNPFYDADYFPRYYGFGPNDTIPLYNKGNLYFDTGSGTWRGDWESPTYWDASRLTTIDPTNTADPYLYDALGQPKAAINTLAPSTGWITDAMYKLSVEYFEGTHAAGEPLNLDGLYYTNNAIFGLVKRETSMQGMMLVNGALVCADLGLLVPGFPDASGTVSSNHTPGSSYAIGLQLNYDKRVKDMLNVKNPNQVVLRRTLWNPTANIL